MIFRHALPIVGLMAAAAASAAPFSFVTWDKTTQTANSIRGSIPTSTGDVGVTLTGDFTDILTNYPSWTPSDTYSGGNVSNAPDTKMLVRVDRAGSYTVAFSRPVLNVAMSLWSVGSGSNSVSYDFNRNVDIVSGGPSTEFGGTRLTQTGNRITGSEGNGTLAMSGTMSGYGFDVIGNETYHGFTIGVQTAQPVPEPATFAALGVGALALLRRRRK